MLGDENRVPPHRCLPAVVPRLGAGKPLDDEAPAVLQDDGEGLLVQISPFLCPEPETAAELALPRAANNSSMSPISRLAVLLLQIPFHEPESRFPPNWRIIPG